MLLLSSPQVYSKEVEEFVSKVHEKSGLDKNGTFLPKAVHPGHTLGR